MIHHRFSKRARSLAVVVLAFILFTSQFDTVQIAATFDPDRLRLVDASISCAPTEPADKTGGSREAEIAACLVDHAGRSRESAEADNNQEQQTTSEQHNQQLAAVRLLVRGNAPLNARGKFDKDMIVSAVNDRINQLLETSNLFQLHPRPRVIVVSLLSAWANDEAAVLQLETDGIAALVSSGDNSIKLLHAPIAGSFFSILPPNHALEWLLSLFRIDATGGAWDLSSKLRELLLQEKSDPIGQPIIVYFHCMRGIDRTGLLAGTYSMRFQHSGMDDAKAANEDVEKRSIQTLEEQSLAWSHLKSKTPEHRLGWFSTLFNLRTTVDDEL